LKLREKNRLADIGIVLIHTFTAQIDGEAANLERDVALYLARTQFIANHTSGLFSDEQPWSPQITRSVTMEKDDLLRSAQKLIDGEFETLRIHAAYSAAGELYSEIAGKFARGQM
jgi:hypothetical protein